MKKRSSIVMFFVFSLVFILVGCTQDNSMIVTSSGIVNGVIEDKYGKRGEVNESGMPTYSLPIKIENAPKGTVSYAIVLEDKDAYGPSGGFSWVHWTAANITRTELKENESQTATDFIQGVNSWTSIQAGQQSAELSSFYGGMAPPDAPHIYELHVFALDTMLDIENGFLMNDLYKKMDGHILEQYTLKGRYDD
ncbi:YbhB/YbcL family Raf kinase inhibitor-like protein [Caldalkalibacillus mannanilyticus]|uniref:YbhB/YbcL family Raf kinase inhibitor-like protein n=1 Tax=Caldalkalibacillus mannanilyticus TaxID=1418 RepID=UPI000A44B250|nr:YbhB/YbcL family Raf kinase inhibitor-like protein [Caldalkalibacillus mannanilyticus]